MENALFYTFSTIPQVLAGAIALLGAFVLYRLQSVNTEVEDESSFVLNFYRNSPRAKLFNLHVKGIYKEVFDNTKDNPPDNLQGVKLDNFKLHHYRLGELLDSKKSLLVSFKWSLWLTVALITVSVIILPLTPKYSGCIYFILPIFSIGIVWLLSCLISYAILIKKALK